jgi:nucleoside phosphorylase
MKLIVAAAWAPELERFRELVPAEVVASGVGIGVVDAAIGTTRLVRNERPSHLIFIGTSGALPRSNLKFGDVVVASGIRLVDGAVAEGRGAMPFRSDDVRLDSALLSTFEAAGARPVAVVTTPSVTTDDALGEKLAAFGDVEHLEAWAVARACEAESVACAVVLGIANSVGSIGREQWKANHVAASARVGELVVGVVAELLRSSTKASSPG